MRGGSAFLSESVDILSIKYLIVLRAESNFDGLPKLLDSVLQRGTSRASSTSAPVVYGSNSLKHTSGWLALMRFCKACSAV